METNQTVAPLDRLISEKVQQAVGIMNELDIDLCEFIYTVGHQLGRATHDGGQSLARRRENTPDVLIETGNVYTAEGLETRIEGRGWISLEEDVLVTDQGPRVLTNPQTSLWLVG